MTHMIDLIDKPLIQLIRFHMFQNCISYIQEGRSSSMLNRDIEDVKKKCKLVGIKITMSDMKNTLDKSNSRLDNADEKIKT